MAKNKQPDLRLWIATLLVGVVLLLLLFVNGGLVLGALPHSPVADQYEYSGMSSVEGSAGGSADPEYLETLARTGMYENGEYLEDITISGNRATIILSSDASTELAESTCEFIINLAYELDYDASAYEDGTYDISEAVVRKRMSPWSMQTCYLS